MDPFGLGFVHIGPLGLGSGPIGPLGLGFVHIGPVGLGFRYIGRLFSFLFFDGCVCPEGFITTDVSVSRVLVSQVCLYL